MLTFAREELPKWAEPYVGALLALGAGLLLVLAMRSAVNAGRAPKKRWGDAIGYFGASVCVATLSCAAMFEIDFFPAPFVAFLSGFVLAGVGGSLAGWQRGPASVP